MKNTIKNCLIAQNYSDAAKGIEIYPNELHYKQINKIFNTNKSFSEISDSLYVEKSSFLQKAFISAKREKVEIFYDEIESCVYFEFPFGQCSFHLFGECWLTENVNRVDGYQWSGLTNTRELLQRNFKNQI